MTCGWMVTGSPAKKPRTEPPTFSMTPDTSWPCTTGYCVRVCLPCQTWMSDPHTPMRFIRTSTCLGPGTGTGTSRNSIFPGEVMTDCFTSGLLLHCASPGPWPPWRAQRRLSRPGPQILIALAEGPPMITSTLSGEPTVAQIPKICQWEQIQFNRSRFKAQGLRAARYSSYQFLPEALRQHREILSWVSPTPRASLQDVEESMQISWTLTEFKLVCY